MTGFPHGRCVGRHPSLYRPCLETLEDRLAPAGHFWTGASSNLWSSPGNWLGGSPAGDPQADLFSPTTTLNLSNINDIVGLTVTKIEFAGGNYDLSGNVIRMILPPLSFSSTISISAPATNSTIAFPVVAFELAVDIA